MQGVYVNSTLWSPAFRSYLVQNDLGDARGFRIPAGAGQVAALPWTNVNEMCIAFDQNVDVSQDDLQVHGVKVADYALNAFSYDAQARTARWTFADGGSGVPILGDKILLDLNGDGGGVVGAGASASGALDGEWTDKASTYPSGDGVPGGDFNFRLDILRADASRDGSVNALDMGQLKSRLNRNATNNQGTGPTAYSVFADLNADGRINALDLGIAKARLNAKLPTGDPTATSLLFSTTRVRR